ncbi:MAG: D-alanyl-D-alanine carboxypeptidase/D-alanyl-D-alanine-endopeptidase, partial [candidate division WOR-3 bacterium]
MFILLTFLININIEAISQSLVDPILESSHTGICIYSLKKDRLVFEHNGAKLFVPASNQKILTTAAALHYLGGEFRYITRLKMRGEIQASSLLGDLILVGSGDPSIKDYSFLERWADIVKNLGVHTIIGSIIVDDRVFSNERLPEGWAWHYLDARYGAEISGFSFNGNVVKVTVKPGNKINDTAQVILDPQTQYVKIKNNLITVESLNGNTISQEINIYREPEANIIHLEGAVAKNFKGRTYEIAVKDPALFAGYYFKELLERRGIRVYGYPKRVDTLTANFGHAER